jgi:hypothetical protein
MPMLSVLATMTLVTLVAPDAAMIDESSGGQA